MNQLEQSIIVAEKAARMQLPSHPDRRKGRTRLPKLTAQNGEEQELTKITEVISPFPPSSLFRENRSCIHSSRKPQDSLMTHSAWRLKSSLNCSNRSTRNTPSLRGHQVQNQDEVAIRCKQFRRETPVGLAINSHCLKWTDKISRLILTRNQSGAMRGVNGENRASLLCSLR